MTDETTIHDQAVPSEANETPTRAQNALEQQRVLDDPTRRELPFETAHRLLDRALEELEQEVVALRARGVIFERAEEREPDVDLNPVAQPFSEVTARLRAATHALRGTSPSG